MSEKIMNIDQLARPCITRERGKEAATKLLKYLNDNRIVLDLNNVEILSFSFLDEFIFWLAGSANMRNIVFRVNDQIICDKLARIVAIRQMWLYYQTGNEKPHLLEPKESKSYKANYIPNKDLLRL